MSTTPSPAVRTITPADELAAKINACWPRLKFAPQQASYKLARLGRYGSRALLAAVEQAYALDESGTRPDWGVIEDCARRNAARSAGRAALRRGDAADEYRRWWASWFAPRSAADPPTHTDRVLSDMVRRGELAWAKEMLDFDVDEPIGLGDWESWWAAADAVTYWRAWHRGPWGQRCASETDGKCQCARVTRCSAAHRRAVERAHRFVRELRQFGPDTRGAKQDWLRDMETEALAGGVKLEHRATVAEQDEMPW